MMSILRTKVQRYRCVDLHFIQNACFCFFRTYIQKLLDSTLFLSRSSRADAHQAMDAIVEEMNANVKAWVSGEKDSNMWRRVVRNHEQLVKLRSNVFSTLQLPDPKSAARAQPSYSKELLAWRARLRPFLCPNGEISLQRPLQSLSPGEDLCQQAVHLSTEGRKRRKTLAEQKQFADGNYPSSRPSEPMHFITVAERDKLAADSRRTIASLRQEFQKLLYQLPDIIRTETLCSEMDSDGNHSSVLKTIVELRQLVSLQDEVQDS
eukprot:scpid67794/ scgid4801/ 